MYSHRGNLDESDTGIFGGNSNWRGPVWMHIKALLIRALLNLYSFYGDEFKVQCPTGSGRYLTLFEVAQEISRRLAKLAKAPFIKVEATKYTEVGYVGKDVESMIRELTDLAIKILGGEGSNRQKI